MNFFNISIVLLVLGFIIFSIVLFVKRYKENNQKIANLTTDNSHQLKASLEEELRKKKEIETEKLKAGDINTINEVIERIFKSSKFVAWVKEKNYNISNKARNIYLSLTLYESEEIISKTKEVILKDGQVYTQNKHELAIRKEYSEKVFNCAYKTIEEIFNNIPTIYKIFINEYIIVENDYKKLVFSVLVNKDQYNTVKNDNISTIDKLNYFKANYIFDKKNFTFEEIQKEDLPSEFSIDQTMSLKVDKNTTFYGNTVLTNDNVINLNKGNTQILNSSVSSNTKITDLSSSVSIDKTILLNKENEDNIEEILNKMNLYILEREDLNNGDKSFKVRDDNQNIILVNFNEDKNKVIKEQNIRFLLGKMITEAIDKGIFITYGNFAIDAFEFASKNNIELFDNDKIKKLI
ncbi:MAG: hypothetical protein KatS3mg068_2169 [Candidatus Sericytochromatia bacterium]|nr:MAG: hypothetical protein KatS3mg068_2169 [Candidatus Sericytochromatia bacterium]